LPRLVALSGTGVTRLTGERFLNEDSLESLLEANPELIALDEVDPSAGLLTPIGRQVPLSGQSLDLLFIDPSCRLTAVEAKLERNAEVRRQVVAQVLEYGAYLSEWTLDDLERQAERYFGDISTPPKYRDADLYDLISEVAVRDLEGEEPPPRAVRELLLANLAAANLRLIVAVDGVVEPLRKLVAFVNRASSFDLYLLEVQQYRSPDGLRIASINLFGGSQKRPGGSPTYGRGVWNEKKFLDVLGGDSPAGGESVVRELLEFIKQESDGLVWGTGAVEGTAGFAIIAQARSYTLFWVTTKGSVWPNRQVLHQLVPSDLRRRLLEYLMALGLPVQERVLDDGRWPSFGAAVLDGEDRIEEFRAIVLAIKHAVAMTEPALKADGAASEMGP
jgi:hypothetical protein